MECLGRPGFGQAILISQECCEWSLENSGRKKGLPRLESQLVVMWRDVEMSLYGSAVAREEGQVLEIPSPY